jgi:transposase-like protein
MICPFCKSKNIAATEFYRKNKDKFPVLYECHDCGFRGEINDLLELRNYKIKKIKGKCIT